MAARRSAPLRRIGLFVEGITLLTPRGRDDLQELWRYQCQKVSGFPPEHLDVYGFSKHQLVLMAANAASLSAARLPLDVIIERAFRRSPFQTLIVAFDAQPANQAITPVPTGPCMRDERDFVLDRFRVSAILPRPFRTEATSLLAHYRNNRGQPRNVSRPPFGDVELVYMDPTFESLVLQDAKALREVFGLSKTPKSWPTLPHVGKRPDFALRRIVDSHRARGPKYLRVPYDAAKHAWAHEVLRNASSTSAVWAHPVAKRLGKVLL